MKTLVIAAAAALLTTPVLAGQADGSISAAEFAAKHFAQDHETGDGPRGVFGKGTDGVSISTSNSVSDAANFALQHFAKDHETGDGPRGFFGGKAGGTVVSTSNQNVAAFAADHLFNGREDER